jgi:hypothetical protein
MHKRAVDKRDTKHSCISETATIPWDAQVQSETRSGNDKDNLEREGTRYGNRMDQDTMEEDINGRTG